MLRVPTHREPTHPGVVLREEFLEPWGISLPQLAEDINLPAQQVEGIVGGATGVTAGVAYRLAKYFGTTPHFWLNLQMVWDLYHAQRSEAAALDGIQPLHWEDYAETDELSEEEVAAC